MWVEYDKEVKNDIIRNTTAASIVELDKYLNEPIIKRSEDPLKWWHNRRLLYPYLYPDEAQVVHTSNISAMREDIFEGWHDDHH